MDTCREKMKARLMIQAEGLIDELLDWGDGASKPNLTQIEEEVLGIRRRFGEQLALGVIERQESKLPVPGPGCRQCRREMEYKGEKEKMVESWVGRLRLERGYYYCPHCRRGLFPPG
jgi:hypothetical protein